MAYSPPFFLEYIEVLTGTELSIIVLGTPSGGLLTVADPAGIMACHGVMDMCNMLKCYGKEYAIVAGFYKDNFPASMRGWVKLAKSSLVSFTEDLRRF